MYIRYSLPVHRAVLATVGGKSGILFLIFLSTNSNQPWHAHLHSSSLSGGAQHLPEVVHAQALVP